MKKKKWSEKKKNYGERCEDMIDYRSYTPAQLTAVVNL